jgi:hypothetical protein
MSTSEPTQRAGAAERADLDDDTAPEDARHLPDGLWAQLREDPLRAPQYLALAAVDNWGVQAREYAERVRREHPDASSRELAEVVRSRHATLARMEGAAAGVPGAFAPIVGNAAALIPDLGALAWIQSRMVIHIAAVYGHDTTSRETAAELLVLQGIYNTTKAARVALAEASERVAVRLVNQYVKGATLVLLRQLFRYVGIRFTRTGLLKAVPFVSVPINAGVNGLSTLSLGKKAINFYDLEPRKKKLRK